jgi:gamma-butyrobetaine dioxygenase
MTSPAVDVIADVFDSAGAAEYLGEAVTVAAHLLQAGALAEAAGAPDPLIAAALLHDVGHLMSEEGGELGDIRHRSRGAAWLSAWFGPAVTEPVRLHVAAKRYLCAVEPSYFAQLSDVSVRTLSLQGGPMSAAETSSFERLPYAADAVAVRRWDDQAKDPSAVTPAFAHFRPLLTALST